MNKFLFVIAFLVLITCNQHSPSLVSAATCTVTVNPGENISNAINNNANGSTICVSPGEYTENVYIDSSKTGGTLLSIQKRAAKITGKPTDTTNHVAAIEINASDFTVQDFEVTGPDIKLGIAAEGNNDIVVGNYVHDIAMNTSCGTDGAAGIGFGDYRITSLTGTAAENLVQRVGLGQNCGYDHGIYFSQPSGNIKNNIVKDVDAFCIHLWHHANNNYQIYNNTLINCGTVANTSAITVGAQPGESSGVTGSTIANNLIVNSSRGIEENHASDNFYRNNMFYQVNQLLDVSCGNGNSNCTNNTTNNPLLNDYRLTAGSPAINSGFITNAPELDYDGNNRYGAPDIGALEYVAPGSQFTHPNNAPNGCNGTCGSDANCITGFTCFNGLCRNATNKQDASCVNKPYTLSSTPITSLPQTGTTTYTWALAIVGTVLLGIGGLCVCFRQ